MNIGLIDVDGEEIQSIGKIKKAVPTVEAGTAQPNRNGGCKVIIPWASEKNKEDL